MKKHRFLWLVLISLFSLGLVTVALAAASHASGYAQTAEATPPPVVAPRSFSPSQPSTFVTNPAGGAARQLETQTRTHPDNRNADRNLGARMMEQAMTASRQPTGTFNPAGGGEWDSGGVWAPTVISDSGQLRMWYSAWPGNQIGEASSPDGIDWAKSPSNPLLDGEQSLVLKEGPNDYKMWLNQGGISLATSNDGLVWNLDPTPVFTPSGQEGTFDRDYVGDPSIVLDGVGTYWMYYEGWSGDLGVVQIGVATSTNGIDWTRVQTEPVLIPGDPGDWDENHVLDPVVLKEGPNDYKMWYSSFDADWRRAIGYATSDDGVNWTKDGNNPVFEPDPGQWDDGEVGDHFVYHEGDYEMWYTSHGKIGYVTSTNGIEWTRFLSGPVLLPGASLYIYVNYAHEWVEASTTPWATVAVTVTDSMGVVKATLTGEANSDGWFGTHQWSWEPQDPDIQPGDTVIAAAVGLTTAVDPIGTIEGVLDVDADTIAGNIHAPWFTPLTLTVRCEVWAEFGPSIEIAGVVADGGSYFCDFSGEWDIQPDQDVAVRYIEPDGDEVINIFREITPWMRVNYAHDWVGGNYEAGHTFWITITDDLGNYKATAEVETNPWQGWGGPGFETWDDLWSPMRPDIEAGDWAYFQSDDGYSNAVQVGDIQGVVDVEDDLVSGPIYADWFTETLYVECHPWGAPGGAPVKDSTAAPDGSSPYTCQWDPLSEWDILPGQDVGVMYLEPDDGDRVINVLREPAPHLWINIWGEGTPASGANYALHVNFNNDGEALAPGVLITHTLEGMVYLADTSGLPHTGTGDPADPLVWQVGDLQPNWSSSPEFYVFVQVVNPPGSGVYADARIDTPLDYYQSDEDSKYSAWGWDEIPEPNVEVNIGKNTWTWDPAPGEDFVYNVNVCNNGDTSSSWVVMTDTLPLSTTLVDWWGQNPGWMEVAHGDHELVVTRPTFQEYWCSEVYLLVRLDETAWPGMELHNMAEVWSSFDWDPNNNYTEIWHNVGQPHPNLGLGPNWIYGTHVPGGQIGYEFYYYNNGNVAVDDVLVTTTLPAGTIFNSAYTWDNLGSYLYPPDLVVSPTLTQDGYAVWNVGRLISGFRKDVGVWLDIDPAAQPGTPLDIQIDVARQPWEDRYDDNTLLHQEGVYDFGPNLRVDKHTNWWWEQWGEDDYLIGHELRIHNLGTEYLENVWITDTLPTSSHLEDWWKNHGPDPMDAFELDGMVVFYVHHLDPGETASLGYRIRFDPGSVQQGMAFTDWMEAPIDGDVNPADNYDSVTAYSGPDVFVNKYLSGGIPEPGAILTFTVEFGNQNRWPWNGDTSYSSLIIDRLPEGMTFITATAPWTPDEHWGPWHTVDNILIWTWGPMWSSSLWWYELVVQLDQDLVTGQVLVNQVEAYGLSPNDIEPDLENNYAEYAVTILGADVELGPSSQAASAAPGTSVTYSLTLTNTGNVPDTFAIDATGVWAWQLSDTSSDELQPGESFAFTLQVTVPSDAQDGQQDTTLVTVQSGYDAAVSATASATTTVSIPYYWLYLPVVSRQ